MREAAVQPGRQIERMDDNFDLCCKIVVKSAAEMQEKKKKLNRIWNMPRM